MKKIVAMLACLISATPAHAQYGYPGPRPPYPMGPYQPYARSPLSRPYEYRSGPSPFYDDGSGYYRERQPDFGPPGFDRRFISPLPYGYPPYGYPRGNIR